MADFTLLIKERVLLEGTERGSDYSLTISTTALGHTSLYDETEYDRVQFSFKGGGSFSEDDNNILINPKRTFTDNLNPDHPSSLDIYNPLINKRKASSII